MATHSSTLAWRIPWTEEPGGLQSKGSQTVDMSEQLNTYLYVFRSVLRRHEESESEERRVVDGDRPEWCSFWLWRWRREPGAKGYKQPLKAKVKVAQSCLTLCDPMDYTVHGILQARVLEWVAFPFSRGSSQPMDWTQVCIAGRFFTSWAKREAQEYWSGWPIPSPSDLPDSWIKPRSPALHADSLPAELCYEGSPSNKWKRQEERKSSSVGPPEER